MAEKKQTNKKWHKCPDCGGRIYDHRPETHQCIPKEAIMTEQQENEIDALGLTKEGVPPEEKPEKKQRKIMTVEETKLGVTMVLSKADCKILEFMPGAHTKQVIKEVRKKLGLPSKEEIKAQRKAK